MTANSELVGDLLAIAVTAARRAGAVLLRETRHEHALTEKQPGRDYVTDADLEIEDVIVDTIRMARPRDGILAEEGTRVDGDRFCWIIDPIDGTGNFVRGLPGFVISIAVQDDTEVIVGVVFDPVHKELFTARRGASAHCNGSPLRVSDITDLSAAIIGTGFSPRNDVRQSQVNTLTDLLEQIGDVRASGVCAYDCCQVAAARLDGYYESGLELWDYAAGALIAQQAGAKARFSSGTTGDAVTVSAPGIASDLERIVSGG